MPRSSPVTGSPVTGPQTTKVLEAIVKALMTLATSGTRADALYDAVAARDALAEATAQVADDAGGAV